MYEDKTTNSDSNSEFEDVVDSEPPPEGTSRPTASADGRKHTCMSMRNQTEWFYHPRRENPLAQLLTRDSCS